MNYSGLKSFSSGLALLALVSLPFEGFGQTLSNGTGGGDWNTPSTWTGGIVPTSHFTIQETDAVTAGPDASLINDSRTPRIYGDMTVNGGQFLLRRLNDGIVTTGSLTVNSGTFSVSRIAHTGATDFTINQTGGVFEIREDIAVNAGNTFNITGGRFTTYAKTINGVMNISSGAHVEFMNGGSGFGGIANGVWNGGRVSLNTNALSSQGNGYGQSAWDAITGAWGSNAINELAMSSKLEKQTVTANRFTNVSQGVLVFNIYSALDNDNDLFVSQGSSAITLGENVSIRIEGVELEGSLEDYIGSTYQLFSASNYSSISATVVNSDLTIGGTLYSGIWWDTSNLAIDGTISVIPEPSTYALMFGGLAIGLAIVRRRKAAA